MPMARRIPLFKLHALCEHLVGRTLVDLEGTDRILYNFFESENMLKEEYQLVAYGPFWYLEGVDWTIE